MNMFSRYLVLLFVVSQSSGMARASSEEDPMFLAVMAGELPRSVQLGTIEVTGADLLDAREGWVEVGPGQCLAVIRRSDWMPRPTRVRVVLRDGQVFPGSFVDGNDERVRIDHPWMRELEIPLDRIDRVLWRSEVSIPPGTVDRVVLVNGDVLSGFIDRIDDPLVVEVEGEEVERIEIPLARVAAVDLAGETTPQSWPQVWTVDGLRMSVPRAAVGASGYLELATHEFMSGAYERLPATDEIVALVLDGSRFAPLATVPVQTISTSPTRRTSPPPRRLNPVAPVGLTDLFVGGPARYEFDLPVDSDHLRTVLHRPRSSRRWPSPVITISRGGHLLWKGEVQEDVLLDLELRTLEGPLVISLDCGGLGPVQCGVSLVDPIVSRVPR